MISFGKLSRLMSGEFMVRGSLDCLLWLQIEVFLKMFLSILVDI